MWAKHQLDKRNYWIFDMDGTLTVSAHDFNLIRSELGLTADVPILEALHAMPTAESEPLWQKLNELEAYYAARSTPMQGAMELLDGLRARGTQLAILTRNTMPVVESTLRACGIDHFFPKQQILDRDSCTPKPSPDGINYLLELWGIEADDAVMVGDYLYDLQAGKSAGVKTIHLDTAGAFAWPEVSDICITEFSELKAYIG